MAEIKIYKITRTKTYMMDELGEGYSLEPWGSNTDQYEGYDDGGKIYMLPDGYKVAESNAGDMHIYNAGGNYCPLTSKFTSPAIVDGDKVIMLPKVNKNFKGGKGMRKPKWITLETLTDTINHPTKEVWIEEHQNPETKETVWLVVDTSGSDYGCGVGVVGVFDSLAQASNKIGDEYGYDDFWVRMAD